MMNLKQVLNQPKGSKGSYNWLVISLIKALAVIFCVMIAVFFIIRIVPGDPAKMILGEYSTPEALKSMHHTLGLDLPLWEQFIRFVKTLFTQGDTGNSIIMGTSTRELITQRAPVTLLLIVMACVLAIFVSLLLATVAATHKDKLLDHLIRIFPTITLGMPIFWVGLLLILLFSVRLGWFPVGGVSEGWVGTLHSLALPAITVAFSQVPTLVRSLRAQMLEVLESDFVVTLKAAGIPNRVILFKHVLRNSALPTLMLLGVNISYLIGGTLVVEQVFGIKGIGSLLFTSISKRDFPVIQGIALYCALSVVIISLLIEIISWWLDPRTKGKQ
ncbi:ABC transporter permease [Paenibacillus sp. FSL R7-0048]|jgi:peptide/nickel transport system permease protein|uniref:ABC transporter permease n=2 Tax=Paenibacillus TaxID=44249 RepID=UPI00096E9588|nr:MULTISPECIES: ABC transporter permease [Paenibacillus]MDH6431499.1 peptide/nickel transport system permease protein [Paenibacillus sp. PastH-4]MDH6447569.1 peptide/nickel transport system permease protein [Paenibacillus sp. PastF-4]MDH6531735.1 peptide/nickel transport system permease protein [Paenibacillus sp. PastH-3]OMD57479.1 peptide ABC transporter permease [Paenibacillus odorifer]OMD66301.1 peptide ABC transporter permease [Paenibacillus odorifer]